MHVWIKWIKTYAWAWLKWIILAAALVGVDLFTKHLAIAHLMKKDAFVIIPNWLELHYAENSAGAMGIDFPGVIGVLSIFTIAVMAVIAWYIFKHRNENKWLLMFLTVIFAGGMGNLVERVFKEFVVDFIYVKIINFPIFNFADICVSLGCIALSVYLLFFYKEKEKESDKIEADSSEGAANSN